MAVVGVSVAKYFPFAGQPDPRLPLGRWGGLGTVAGDGSGGTAKARLIIAGSGSVYGPAFSIDLIAGYRGDTGVESTALLQILGSSFDEEVVLTNWQWSVPLVAGGALDRIDTSFLQFPFFIGTRRRGAGDPTCVELHFQTNTNAVTYAVSAHGLYWARESLRLPGGPLRPEQAQVPIPAVPGGQSYYDRLRAGTPR